MKHLRTLSTAMKVVRGNVKRDDTEKFKFILPAPNGC